MLRVLKRWLRSGSSHSKSKGSIEFEDEVYEQNKVWITIVLQLLYLLFLCVCIPYVFLVVPPEHKWLPLHVFFVITGGCSLVVCFLYFKLQYSQPMYLSLAAYGTVFPYMVWICEKEYMAVTAASWNWLTLSMVLMSLLSSSREGLWLLVIQILTPAAGAIADIYGGFGLDINRFVLRALSTIIPDCTIYLVLLFFSQVLAHSRDQALLRHELGLSILRNILPMPVADKLMEGLALSCRISIAHDYSMATVAFCDIVGFTQLCLTTTPAALVDTLNNIFTYFDRLCLVHGVEKIKTIGDAYMFAGFPANDEAPNEAAVAVVHVAVDMVRHMATFCIQDAHLEVRAGVNSGPVVAGVIGCTKFAYDIWGPTVNMASRLESSGVPGEVQVSSMTRDLLQDKVPSTFRGNIPLKGAGNHDTYLIDLANVPPTVASPEMLEGLGLADIAYLVQEINRRQASYVFAAGSTVAPLTRCASATISPRTPCRATRHGPLSPSSWRRSVLGTPLSINGRFQSDDEPQATRTNRIQHLMAAVEGSNNGVSSSLPGVEDEPEPLQPLAGSCVFSRRTRSCIITGQLEPTVSAANLLPPDGPPADDLMFNFPRTHTLNIDLDIHCPAREAEAPSDEFVPDAAANEVLCPVLETMHDTEGTASAYPGSPKEDNCPPNHADLEAPEGAQADSRSHSPRRVTLNLNPAHLPLLLSDVLGPSALPRCPLEPGLHRKSSTRGSMDSSMSSRRTSQSLESSKAGLHASPMCPLIHLSPPRRQAVVSCHASPNSCTPALSQASCFSPKPLPDLRAFASLSRISPSRNSLLGVGNGPTLQSIVPQYPHAPDSPPQSENPRHRHGRSPGRSGSVSPPIPSEDWKECFLPPFMRKASLAAGLLRQQPANAPADEGSS